MLELLVKEAGQRHDREHSCKYTECMETVVEFMRNRVEFLKKWG